MQAIAGYFRLDGAPARVAELAVLRAALISNPSIRADRFDGHVEGAVALGGAQWGLSSGAGWGPGTCRDDESGCLAVVDARLDNSASLAARLGLRSDRVVGVAQAQLVLGAWLRWGERCVEHLRGDFAFAVWDPRQRRLFCARDIMGVRPLCIHHRPGQLFAFASRAQALLALPGVPVDLDEGRVADALVPQLEGIDKTSTCYRAVRRLPPAHVVVVEAGGFRQRRYWRLEPGLVPVPKSDSAWAQAVGETLERAVGEHLQGPLSVGCMLSGGMDSSSLAVIAADQLAHAGRPPLPTFSSVDDDPACEETRAIRAMLEYPGFSPTLIDPIAIDAVRGALRDAIDHGDEPFDVFMVLLHAQYLAAAQAGVNAVIDGVDGDMLFSTGSGLVRALRQLRWLGVWRNIRGYQRIHPGLSAWRYLSLLCRGAFVPDALRRCIRRDRLQTQVREEIQSGFLAPEFAARIDLRDRLRRFDEWGARGPVPGTVEQALGSLDHPFTTCGMERYHRVAAWHGIDPRHPMTDRGVLELCVNLPDRQRMRDGWTKAVLRHAMRGRLPDPVCWRTGKQHLGWSLIERVLLDDVGGLAQRLAERRDVLAPYVDLRKLDGALRTWGQPAQSHETRVTVLTILGLGDWLARQVGARRPCEEPAQDATAAAKEAVLLGDVGGMPLGRRSVSI